MAKADKFHKTNKKLVRLIGIKIRECRRKAGLTIEELGNIANVNYKYLQRCETGRVNISISVLYSIAKGLRVQLKHFLSDIK
jgi:transcriptional regulator with XRE-family HTH domain